MIPRKIHYCWFGRKELPELAKKCIASWEKFCPDWEIIQWNEDNFPIRDYPYAQYCLENKKWAFLSDIVRLVVVNEQGGVYLDTDVEMLRPLDALCSMMPIMVLNWRLRSIPVMALAQLPVTKRYAPCWMSILRFGLMKTAIIR